MSDRAAAPSLLPWDGRTAAQTPPTVLGGRAGPGENPTPMILDPLEPRCSGGAADPISDLPGHRAAYEVRQRGGTNRDSPTPALPAYPANRRQPTRSDRYPEYRHAQPMRSPRVCAPGPTPCAPMASYGPCMRSWRVGPGRGDPTRSFASAARVGPIGSGAASNPSHGRAGLQPCPGCRPPAHSVLRPASSLRPLGRSGSAAERRGADTPAARRVCPVSKRMPMRRNTGQPSQSRRRPTPRVGRLLRVGRPTGSPRPRARRMAADRHAIESRQQRCSVHTSTPETRRMPRAPCHGPEMGAACARSAGLRSQCAPRSDDRIGRSAPARTARLPNRAWGVNPRAAPRSARQRVGLRPPRPGSATAARSDPGTIRVGAPCQLRSAAPLSARWGSPNHTDLHRSAGGPPVEIGENRGSVAPTPCAGMQWRICPPCEQAQSRSGRSSCSGADRVVRAAVMPMVMGVSSAPEIRPWLCAAPAAWADRPGRVRESWLVPIDCPAGRSAARGWIGVSAHAARLLGLLLCERPAFGVGTARDPPGGRCTPHPALSAGKAPDNPGAPAGHRQPQ